MPKVTFVLLVCSKKRVSLSLSLQFTKKLDQISPAAMLSRMEIGTRSSVASFSSLSISSPFALSTESIFRSPPSIAKSVFEK